MRYLRLVAACLAAATFFVGASVASAAITLTSPAANSTQVDNVHAVFTLDEAANPGTVKMVFSATGGGAANRTVTFSSANETPGTYTFDFPAANPVASVNVASIAGGSSLPDGTYSVQMQYVSTATSLTVTSTAHANVVIDTQTLTPSLDAPAWNASFPTGNVSVTYTLPEARKSGSIKLTLAGSTTTYTLTMIDSGVGQVVKAFSARNPLLGGAVVSAVPFGPIQPGAYLLTLSYQDIHNHPAASAATIPITIAYSTLPPALTTPTANSVSSSPLQLSYTLPQDAAPGTVNLVFIRPLTGSIISTVTLNTNTAGTYSFSLDLHNPAGDPVHVSGVAPQAPIPDGTYNLVLGYQDAAGDPAATVTATSVTIDQATQPPLLLQPGLNADVGPNPIVAFHLSENALAGSVQLVLSSASSTHTLTLATSTGDVSFPLNMINPTSGPVVSAQPPGPIPGGTYSVMLRYQDALGNPAGTDVHTGVVVHTTTMPPTLSNPVSGASLGALVPVAYQLPTAAAAGTVKLVVAGATIHVLTLAATTAGTYAWYFDANNPAAASEIASVTPTGPIPSGQYMVHLEYGDAFGNPVAATTPVPITVQAATIAPVLITPAPMTTTGAQIQLAYTLPETAAAGSVTLTFAGSSTHSMILATTQRGTYHWSLDPAHPELSSQILAASLPATIPPGTYTITLAYRDAAGNTPMSTNAAGVTVGTAAPVAPVTLRVKWRFTAKAAAAAGTLTATLKPLPAATRYAIALRPLRGKPIKGRCRTLSARHVRVVQCTATITHGKYQIRLVARDATGVLLGLATLTRSF